MLYDHTTISCQEITRSHHQMKAQGHQASFQATPRPAQPPKGKHSAPSSKSAHKIIKKIGDSWKKQALVEDNGKSFGEKLRLVVRYTFYRRILPKRLGKPFFPAMLLKSKKTKRKNGISEIWNFLLRSPFGRPTLVWGPAAVGAAIRFHSSKPCRICTTKLHTAICVEM